MIATVTVFSFLRYKVGDIEIQYRQGNKRVIESTLYTVGVTLRLPQAAGAVKHVAQ